MPEFLTIEQVSANEALRYLWEQANSRVILLEATEYLIHLGITNRINVLKNFPGILAVYMADRRSGKIGAFTTFDLMAQPSGTNMIIRQMPRIITSGVTRDISEKYRDLGFRSILNEQLNSLSQNFNL
ncbi:MAG TPA: hypothetical protein VJC17_04625 [Candidatus Dojkabacteria bacterium]|nr:hypothetical protein [Candidatus Dojkabacteria bacterium]